MCIRDSIRKGKILTFVPTGLTSAGESRSRFRLELNEELEGSIFSSNALMSTSAVLRAGGLVVGNIPMGASGSERGSKMDYLRERRHLPGRVGSGGARAANIRSNIIIVSARANIIHANFSAIPVPPVPCSNSHSPSIARLSVTEGDRDKSS